MKLHLCVKALKLLLFVAMSVVISTSSARAEEQPSNDYIFPFATVSGSEIFEDNYESYVGGYVALNGDLDKDGLILRVLVSKGDYEFNDGVTNIDADYVQGDIMLGYQVIRNDTNYSLFFGVDYEEHDLSPDSPHSKLRGTEVGFKVAWGLETERYKQSPLYWAIRGDYTTAFDTYYNLARIGYDIGRFVVGPEGWVLGDESGDAQRVGAFALYDINLGDKVGTISVSGGYQFVDNANSITGDNFGEEGAYGTLKFTMGFGQ